MTLENCNYFFQKGLSMNKGNEIFPEAQNYNPHIYMQPDVVDL